MASTTEQQFITLLRGERFKRHLFPYLSTSDICALRSTSSALCNLLTKHVFTRVHVTFNATTFTKQSRLNALSRIGHHIEHLTFYFPHTEATFLPPLVHPETGEEISFLYTPHTSVGDVLSRPKYGNSRLGEILTQQYPPLFHSATNVPSFINAMKSMPNMRHLTIWCPGQEPNERYRRDVVDYALISLRISLERAPMHKLNKLSLSSVHPSAFNYLRHSPGIGSVPSASRRWRQIKKLYISVEAWDFYGTSPGLDHLKVLDDYIRSFAPTLEKMSFTWRGSKGPCPVALADDPLFAPSRTSKKLFNEVTSVMSPLPDLPSRSPIHFPKLRFLQIRNAAMNAPQLKNLIVSHRDTVKEFDFEHVVLANKGDWDEALSPIDRDASWSRSSLTTSSEFSFVSSDSSEDLPFPSAAAEAASRELLSEEMGAFCYNDEERQILQDLPEEDLEAREDTMSVTTTIRRRRIRRRRQKSQPKPQSENDQRREVSEECRPERSLSSSSSSLTSHHKRSWPHLKRSSGSEANRPPTPPMPTTGPILNPEPKPVLLQPATYDPSARKSVAPDEGISAVQRNFEQEEAHRRLAEDAGARMSALRKAKQAVLTKLSREFYGNNKKTSSRTTDAVAACRLMASREFSGCGMEVIEDHRELETQSILVPLMFARA